MNADPRQPNQRVVVTAKAEPCQGLLNFGYEDRLGISQTGFFQTSGLILSQFRRLGHLVVVRKLLEDTGKE
jgi:hypothetical protein